MPKNINTRFAPFEKKMKQEKLPEIVIDSFRYYYEQLVKGNTGMIPESDIRPVTKLPDSDTFSHKLAELGGRYLSKTVFLKLNGGLGTSMGLDAAKSMLTVKNGYSFLDITIQQALRIGCPLVLMNSYKTHNDTKSTLDKYPELDRNIPLDFKQYKVLKVSQTDFKPAKWDKDPDLEWCPPGHGEIYTALVTSGMLDKLLDAGYEYVFVANIDNLGAVIDTRILGYIVENKLPFLMEVADRTEADKKGGHLASRIDGQLILRELAQCPVDDLQYFQDIERFKYFNTNNLWIDLKALQKLMKQKNNILGLPMIRNSKTVDPRDSSSQSVYQLETAMGSAIAVFKGAGAVRVPRSRFLPVKTTADLLAIRSDIYKLTEEFRLIPNPERTLDTINISLDPDYYKIIDDMEARFSDGSPSLVDCKKLALVGDIKFGNKVSLKGSVMISNHSKKQMTIQDKVTIGCE